MPDIMEKCGGNNKETLIIGKLEPAACNVSKEHGTEGMLEPGMVSTGVNEVGEAKLPDVTETLEHGRIEQPERKILHLDIAMDRVLDDL
jgi:hypothetical protein